MIFRGTLYMTDDLDMAYKSITDPIHRGVNKVLSLDEQESELERMFPYNAFKATCLLPPPNAIFHQIDGDQDAFVNDYISYLQCDMVVDFISAILTSLLNGINILIYVPSFGEDIVWINILLQYMETTYGLHMGTSLENPYRYDETFDIYNANIMYLFNTIDVTEYMRLTPDNYRTLPQQVAVKIQYDLASQVAPGENPIALFYQMRAILHINPLSKVTPAVSFDL